MRQEVIPILLLLHVSYLNVRQKVILAKVLKPFTPLKLRMFLPFGRRGVVVGRGVCLSVRPSVYHVYVDVISLHLIPIKYLSALYHHEML